jgi:hypothetical protein
MFSVVAMIMRVLSQADVTVPAKLRRWSARR